MVNGSITGKHHAVMPLAVGLFNFSLFSQPIFSLGMSFSTLAAGYDECHV